MCGRFVSASPPDELARYFGAEQVTGEALAPSFNVAPTRDIYVVVETGGVRRLETFHWGLIPFWAKDPKVGQRMINARADGLAAKGAYKQAFRERRCLIPVDGFYEWRKQGGRKQPVYIARADGEPLALAGLWERWKPKDTAEDESTWVRSCTIVTGEPNDLVAQVHDRMPVLLPPSAWSTWLDGGNDDLDALGQLLVPAPSDLLVAHPVSPRVNSVANDDSALVEPFDPDAPAGQATLL